MLLFFVFIVVLWPSGALNKPRKISWAFENPVRPVEGWAVLECSPNGWWCGIRSCFDKLSTNGPPHVLTDFFRIKANQNLFGFGTSVSAVFLMSWAIGPNSCTTERIWMSRCGNGISILCSRKAFSSRIYKSCVTGNRFASSLTKYELRMSANSRQNQLTLHSVRVRKDQWCWEYRIKHNFMCELNIRTIGNTKQESLRGLWRQTSSS